MAKEISESSPPKKLTRRSAERIFSKPLTKAQCERLAKLIIKLDAEIDLSDRRLPLRTSGKRIDMQRQTWANIKAQIKPETRNRMEAEGIRLSNEHHLAQLRKARGLTQETVAELLGVSQAEVSKMERRSELYIGTLKKFIEAMNAELVLAVRFADGIEVPIRLGEDDAT